METKQYKNIFIFFLLAVIISLSLALYYQVNENIIYYSKIVEYEKMRESGIAEKVLEQINEKVDFNFDKDFEDDYFKSLIIKFANTHNVIYKIRNEILYQCNVRNVNIKMEKASYQAMWIYLSSISSGVDPLLLTILGIQESGLQHFTDGEITESNKKAVGMFQLTPVVSNMYNINPLVFEENVMTAAKFLAKQINRYDSVRLALAHYNAGSKVHTALKEYPETINFVSNITKNYEKIK